LMFAIDAMAPQQVALAVHAAPPIEKSTLRIRSDQKWPERVVYDTTLPTIVPQAVTVAAAAPPSAGSDVASRPALRDAFAQIEPRAAIPAEPRKLDAQPVRKRKIAKVNTNPALRVAQQSHPGFFGPPVWNSTW